MDQPTSVAGWLQLLEARSGEHRIELGLGRVARVWQRLWGERPFPYPVVTVGGTNGKGSTCAFLEAIYHAAGYRVGCYTSPHLLRYHERIRLCGQPVDDEPLIAAFAAVEAARDEVALTYFEHGTLAALWLFAHTPLDLVILEVGMGGRLDAVNLIDPDVAIITCVDLDHQAYLGPDRESIGREKAGIFRPGRPAVVADPSPPTTVVDIAQQLGAPLWRIGHEFGYERQEQQWRWWAKGFGQRAGLPAPALRGAGQWHNASAALLAVTLLAERLPVAQQAVRQGLTQVTLPGRFQVLPGTPSIIVDVAHNPHAAAALAQNLQAISLCTAIDAVFGCYSDKDAAGMVAALAPLVRSWWLVDTPGPRGQKAEKLLAAVRSQVGEGVAVTPVGSVAVALERLIERAASDDKIIVFGSFSLVGEALQWREAHLSTKR